MGVPAGILEDVPEDDRRSDGRAVAHSDVGTRRGVASGDGPEPAFEGDLRDSLREVGRFRAADRGGHRVCGERLDGVVSESGEHRVDLGFRRPQMPRFEAFGQLWPRDHRVGSGVQAPREGGRGRPLGEVGGNRAGVWGASRSAPRSHPRRGDPLGRRGRRASTRRSIRRRRGRSSRGPDRRRAPHSPPPPRRPGVCRDRSPP